ncbi:hypothetical protein [Priestia taiwanensis]|uniref:Uncharacterized protein n=1 Tax=Priestia taiwanensis TaxID=1347902 RepID=A0A917APP5_9BACI|nr:hypothetical protein [Priestia taiwanensis]MBM7362736.1 hypothetical protein [Priestia taiwanensis]GGE64654.1 hypothetical protein GCM10007140_13600 [Priestia taiwanensis]
MLRKILTGGILASILFIGIPTNVSAEVTAKKWVERHERPFYNADPNHLPSLSDYNDGDGYIGTLNKVDQACSQSQLTGDWFCYGYYSGWIYAVQ